MVLVLCSCIILRAVVFGHVPGLEFCCFVHDPSLLTVCNVLIVS